MGPACQPAPNAVTASSLSQCMHACMHLQTATEAGDTRLGAFQLNQERACCAREGRAWHAG